MEIPAYKLNLAMSRCPRLRRFPKICTNKQTQSNGETNKKKSVMYARQAYPTLNVHEILGLEITNKKRKATRTGRRI